MGLKNNNKKPQSGSRPRGIAVNHLNAQGRNSLQNGGTMFYFFFGRYNLHGCVHAGACRRDDDLGVRRKRPDAPNHPGMLLERQEEVGDNGLGRVFFM